MLNSKNNATVRHILQLKKTSNRYRDFFFVPLAPLTATLTISSIVDLPSTSSFFFIDSGKTLKSKANAILINLVAFKNVAVLQCIPFDAFGEISAQTVDSYTSTVPLFFINSGLHIEVRVRLFKPRWHTQNHYKAYKCCSWSLHLYWSATGRSDGSRNVTGLKFENRTRTQSLTRQ